MESSAFEFANTWLWLVFATVGLVMILLELIIGVAENTFDLIFLGSAFILGGLITWQIESWIVTVAVTGVICLIYFFIGRKYINKWMITRKTKTNIDTIIGKTGIVLQSISKHVDGLVKVGHEEWRARSEEDIEKGFEIVVTDIKGVTLIVKINKGGE